MKKLQFLIALALFSTLLQAQQPPIKISWTGELNCGYCQLDSVIVTKKATGEQVVFRYPDTVLMYSGDVRITPPRQEQEMGLKTYPNPFPDKAVVEFSLVQAGAAELVVYDMLGREVIRQHNVLEKGTHRFSVDLPNGMYSLSLQTETGKQSVRLLSQGSETTAPQIVYAGNNTPLPPLEGGIASSTNAAKSPFEGGKGDVLNGGLPQKSDNLPFQYGDTLVLQGFISDEDAFQYKKTQEVTLTGDALVTFAFFNELAYIDTVEFTAIETFMNLDCKKILPCYYYSSVPLANDYRFVYSPNAIPANFLLVTTQVQLDSLFACADTLTPPDVDFEQQTLLLVKWYLPRFPAGISNISFSLTQLCNEHFILQADIFPDNGGDCTDFAWMLLINRPLSKEQISTIINFKNR